MISNQTDRRLLVFVTLVTLLLAQPAAALLDLGPEEIVQASGVDLAVPGYSVPSLIDWNNDTLEDLIIGEGGGGVADAKVRVYLNVGTPGAPSFSGFFYVQSDGADLTLAASGCLGLFPRVVYWDGDGRKDLLVGTAQGNLRIYLNTNTDEDPAFDRGTVLQVGPIGGKVDIDIGLRATPTVVDWNNDTLRDLVVGAYDGKIHLFINSGTDTDPDYLAETFAQESGGDLVVPGYRSSPHVAELDDDGKKDLLVGNTNGQLLLYTNTGSDTAPYFSGYVAVEADGVPIDLVPTRSRPFVCDWTGDGWLDVLIGVSDGLVHLFQGQDLSAVPPVATVCELAAPWPNPFNPRVTVTFTLTESRPVKLAVFDLAGRQVASLAERTFAAGTNHVTWDGQDPRGRALPSGLYLVHLETPGFSAARKLILQR